MKSNDLVNKIITLLDEKKAIDIKHFDLATRGSFAAHIIIATANSSRFIYALSQYIGKLFKDSGIVPHIEGTGDCEWVLVFGDDILIHLFLPESRRFYNLEELWEKRAENN